MTGFDEKNTPVEVEYFCDLEGFVITEEDESAIEKRIAHSDPDATETRYRFLS